MIEEQKKIDKELSVLDIWNIFSRHVLFISITTFVFFILSAFYVFFVVVPDYKSNADVMIQVEQDTSSTSNNNFDLVNAFRLIDTVAELMTKEVVLEKTLIKLEEKGYENLDVKYLRDGLEINSSSSSYFITISFVDENKILAADVVDSVIDAVIEVTDIRDAFPVLTDKIRRTSFATDAIYNSPNAPLVMFLGFLLGTLISVSVVFTRELVSNRFKNKDEVETMLNLPVLTVVPMMEKKEKKNAKSK